MHTKDLTQRGEISETVSDDVQRAGASAFPSAIPKIKKLPRELRRRQFVYKTESRWTRRVLVRLRTDSQYLRSFVQLAFVLLCVWIGVEFFLFMRWGQSDGTAAFYSRPPGAEGFLPISALISFKYWLQTGVVNAIHPAGLFIFLAIAAIGLLLKKAFCSWLCPVGTLSESLWMFGRKLFGKNISVPRFLDYPLRALKYILLLFFASAIAGMDVDTLRAFVHSPYNKVADIKMYLFFAQITPFAFWTIIVLAVGSVFVKNFWCRYLCPYGALLGILGQFSPVKITRNAASCIDCALCTKACPSSILVHRAGRVRSDECTACYACVEVCPVKDTLVLRAGKNGRAVPSLVFGLLVAGVFAAVTGLAMLTGHWTNEISKKEYLHRIRNIDSPLYQHNRGEVPKYGPND